MINSALLSTALLLFPFWMQIWDERPFNSADMNLVNPLTIDEETLAKVDEGLSIPNYNLHLTLMTQLMNEPVPACQELFQKHLAMEKDERVKAGFLSMLQKGNLDMVPASLPQSGFTGKTPLLREASIRLYSLLNGADHLNLLPFLPSEGNEPVVRIAAWEAFAKYPAFADCLGQDVINYKNDPLPQIQALALETALIQSQPVAGLEKWVRETAEKGSALCRLALARHPKQAYPLQINALAKQESPIRITLYNAVDSYYIDLLFAAANDPDAVIRATVCSALGNFTEWETENLEKAKSILYKGLSDVPAVQAQAYDSLSKLIATHPGILSELNDILVQAPLDAFRLNAYRLILSFKYAEAIPTVIKRLPTEKNSENISAALECMAFLAPKYENRDLLLKYLKHPSPLVRQSLARALGRLQIDNAEEALTLLSTPSTEPAEHVREEAFEAMGRCPRRSYVALELKCLLNTAVTTSVERANAAWAAAQQTPRNTEDAVELLGDIENRMFEHCTVAVVPAMAMMMFDSVDVISNCMYALAVLAQKYPEENILNHRDTILGIYDVPYDEIDNSSVQSGTLPFPRTCLTSSLARQLAQWVNGEEITRQEQPYGKVYFDYAPASKD